jgi:serine kinase of HPr protein (carbohydrate metabolism regulator)
MQNRYKIADKVVEINSIYEEVHKYCSDYLTDEPADYSVTTTQTDIDFERDKSAHEDEIEGIPTRHFSECYLEELAVYRKIAEKILDYDTILFHGSVVSVDGIGYLFTAKSGTGKSTHTRLWREYFGDRTVMVNDDKPLLKISGSGVIAYGTPYNGKHRLGTNISVPLKAICILTRAADNHIEHITREQAYTMLLQQVYRPADMLKMTETLKLVDRLADNVKLYRLGCNMDISAAKVAFEGMQ